jgi:hypothetical protein
VNLSDIMTYVRLGVTGATTALGVLATYYPHMTWIPAAIGVVATISAHVVPSVQQSKTP